MIDEEPTMLDTHDEIALPHFEDRLEEALGTLHDQTRATAAAAAAADTDAADTPRPRRSRPWSIGLAGAAVAAAAAITVGTVAVVAPAKTDKAEASVEEQVVATMRRVYAGSVVHVTTDREHFLRSEDWTDYRTGAHHTRWFNEDGSVQSDEGVVRPTNGDPAFYRRVDHCTRQYTEEVQPISPVEILRDNADWWLDDLERGTLVEDGTETVDGRDLLRFRYRHVLPTSTVVDEDGNEETVVADEDDVRYADQRILVDPDTHELVRMVSDFGTAETGVSDVTVEDYEFLDRTPETAALATIPVPDGYTRVDPEGTLHVDGIPTIPVAC